nr:YezD family protein [Caldalkalibacillus mannanilyticus]
MFEQKRNKEVVEHILQSLEGLEYGSIQITVHDSQITQIERIEKLRFPSVKNRPVKNQTASTNAREERKKS